MSDDELNLPSSEAAALRQAAQQFGDEGRVIMRPSRRLAALRAQAAAGTSARRPAEPVSHWPAAAVAAIALSMLGLALLWGKASLRDKHERASAKTVAEDVERPDNPAPAPEASPAPAPDKNRDQRAARKQDADAAQFDATETLAAGAALHVDNSAGDITISEGDTDAVAIHATKRVTGGQSSVKITILGQSLEYSSKTAAEKAELLKHVDVRVQHRANGDLEVSTQAGSVLSQIEVNYDIRVPRGARLGRITTSDGDIAITGGSGNAALETVSGNIHVTGTRGVVAAKSSDGEIELTETTGAGKIETVVGDITVKGVPQIAGIESSNGRIQVADAQQTGAVSCVSGNIHLIRPGTLGSVHTSNGDILIERADNVGPVSTVSGSIHLKQCGGLIRAESSNGDIELSGASGIQRLSTVSGDISADVGDLAAAAQIHTSNGTVQLRLSEKLNATISAKTSNGSVESSIRGIKPVQKGEFDISEALQGTLGDGSRKLTIDTVSGDISLAPLR